MDSNKHIGKPCFKCSGTLRYNIDGRCVPCRRKNFKKVYQKRDKLALNDYSNTWRRKNPEKRTIIKHRYYVKNKSRYMSYVQRRKELTKSILTKEEINHIIRIYDLRKLLTEVTGELYHVDHKIPLSKGGMHHPLNLQILTAYENLSKGDRL